MDRQKGQTIIETMVAVFILTMGIGAALSLASYSLNATTSIRKQIIGMGLAREGVEAVKNMRDTNWLRARGRGNSGVIDNDCYNFTNATNTGSCWSDWLNTKAYGIAGYDIGASPSGQEQYLDMNWSPTASNDRMWDLKPGGSANGKYCLYYDPTLANGLYKPTGQAVTSNACKNKDPFGRKITITQENFGPFNSFDYNRINIKVEVWWSDKRCPLSDDPPTDNKCKVTLQTYLTNWKDY